MAAKMLAATSLFAAQLASFMVAVALIIAGLSAVWMVGAGLFALIGG